MSELARVIKVRASLSNSHIETRSSVSSSQIEQEQALQVSADISSAEINTRPNTIDKTVKSKASMSNSRIRQEPYLGTIFRVSGGGSATTDNDYNNLINKPKLEYVELVGNTTLEDIGLDRITNSELEEIFSL